VSVEYGAALCLRCHAHATALEWTDFRPVASGRGAAKGLLVCTAAGHPVWQMARTAGPRAAREEGESYAQAAL